MIILKTKQYRCYFLKMVIPKVCLFLTEKVNLPRTILDLLGWFLFFCNAYPNVTAHSLSPPFLSYFEDLFCL